MLLSRPGKNGQPPHTVVVDFTKIFQYGILAQNYSLQEGDMTMAPNSPLTQLNIDLEKVIGPITGAGATVSAGQGVTGH